jgi:hypothetical protein
VVIASVGSAEIGNMDRLEALKLLKGGRKGIDEWNGRRESDEEIPDLIEADLRGADLRWANLNGADLAGANLSGADLSLADLAGAELRGADLSRAKLHRASLIQADLREAELTEADLNDASCGWTIFADVDLSEVNGLDSVGHDGPSTIGIDTLFRSQGKIPEAFLRGCGVPNSVIVNRFALIGATEPIQFYSCFISYSTSDEEFAKRLHARMVQEKLRVWFAPEDMRGGKKLHEQVERAIQLHDRLLLVLSENSIKSKWVSDEIRRAREVEVSENRRKLFPIRLVDLKTVQAWKCFDADLAEDLAAEIRQYFLPDFSNWKDHDSFETSFARLLEDLKAEESIGSKPV